MGIHDLGCTHSVMRSAENEVKWKKEKETPGKDGNRGFVDTYLVSKLIMYRELALRHFDINILFSF